MLPSSLLSKLTEILDGPPQEIRPVGGGGISQAVQVQAGERSALVKWHARPPVPLDGWPDMFEAEARGLGLLASSCTLRVPAVLGYGTSQAGRPAFIVMEWVQPGSGDRATAGQLLGRGLAALQRITADAYGLDHGNYCGATPQDNRWNSSWIEFYGQRRLGFQMDLAGQRGRMPGQRRQRLERLIARLGEWIDEGACRPSLLHGDLWGGNWLVDSAGQPVLIDPAVYYGDREAELAMCRLFGGFPATFYQAYDAAWPPAAGRGERVALYQLYHVLNHLNLFGEGYGGQVDAILARYVG
jgi:fructosamine-3-kinase